MESQFISSKIMAAVSFITVLSLTSCAQSENNLPLGTAMSEWDFDHHVQFKKTKFDEHNYQLEVIPNSKVNFERLSVFLLRRSYLICGGYGYKLELITGIESFDHFRASPNMIMPNLTAKIECPIEQ